MEFYVKGPVDRSLLFLHVTGLTACVATIIIAHSHRLGYMRLSRISSSRFTRNLNSRSMHVGRILGTPIAFGILIFIMTLFPEMLFVCTSLMAMMCTMAFIAFAWYCWITMGGEVGIAVTDNGDGWLQQHRIKNYLWFNAPCCCLAFLCSCGKSAKRHIVRSDIFKIHLLLQQFVFLVPMSSFLQLLAESHVQEPHNSGWKIVIIVCGMVDGLSKTLAVYALRVFAGEAAKTSLDSKHHFGRKVKSVAIAAAIPSVIPNIIAIIIQKQSWKLENGIEISPYMNRAIWTAFISSIIALILSIVNKYIMFPLPESKYWDGDISQSFNMNENDEENDNHSEPERLAILLESARRIDLETLLHVCDKLIYIRDERLELQRLLQIKLKKEQEEEVEVEAQNLLFTVEEGVEGGGVLRRGGGGSGAFEIEEATL